MVEAVAHLHASPERAVRVVVVELVSGGRSVQAFYSTCTSATAVEILGRYTRGGGPLSKRFRTARCI